MHWHKEDISIVKHWLTYQDFERLMQNETFIPLNLSAFQCIGNIPDISVSERWFRFNRTYIPKNMIFDFAVVNGPTLQKYDTVRLFAMNGFEWKLIEVKNHQVKGFLQRMADALGRRTAGSFHNEVVVRNMHFTKAFQSMSRKFLIDKDAFIKYISIPIRAPEYMTHPFTKECIRFSAACFIERSMQTGSRYFWWMSSDYRVYSKKTGFSIALLHTDGREDSREQFLKALIKTGIEKQTMPDKEICVLREHQFDFPYNENIRKACVEFCGEVRALSGE